MTSINAVTALGREGAIAIITLNAPPVNALSEIMREGVIAALGAAEADPQIHAILLLCAGRTFIAGADIAEFDKIQTGASLRDVQDAFDAVTKPIIAALHGTILGGGLEVAMCAHYRVALPSARLGQPEVTLGLVPGAGGTQRLPRLVGVPKALAMVTDGKPITAADALTLGLVDALLLQTDIKEGGLAFARQLLAEGKTVRRTRDRDEKITGVAPEIFAGFRQTHAFKGFEAPGDAIRCIEAAVTLPFEDGLEFERVVFEARKHSAQSLALRYAFFAERKAAKIPGLPDDTQALAIESLGVVGGGTMGGGIAMAFANAGLPVTLVESSEAALAKSLAAIAGTYESAVARGRLTPDEAQARLGRIKGTRALEDVAPCDLVVEAVFERMDVKKDIFTRLDAIAPRHALLASNTSFLDLDEIARATAHPERMLGLHFFAPAAVMRLVEVVRGAKTSNAALATAMKLAKAIGKLGVAVGASPGFVGNRMAMQRQAQADRMVLEGAAPAHVDRVMTAFGFPMGPFAMADLAGLDLDLGWDWGGGWDAAESKSESLRALLCEAGRLGQKSGGGYYDYDAARKPVPSPVADRLLAQWRAKNAVIPRTISDREILERCLYPLINEGAKILDEGVAARASDIDVIWLSGYGFPAYRGGPMYYADVTGLGTIAAALRGHGVAPAPLLERLAGEKRNFANR